MIYKGCRREDQPQGLGGLPSKINPGDFWRARVQDKSGEHWEWWVAAPNLASSDPKAYAVGRIPKHTVIEEDDGSITVMPDQARDGHMNSILIMRKDQQLFHGWIKKGNWSESYEELQREISD